MRLLRKSFMGPETGARGETNQFGWKTDYGEREGHIPGDFHFTIEASSPGMWPDLSLSLLSGKPI
jgi:hypothetical protein